jgi:hypothetical protein
LERTISAFFDYIENIIGKRETFTMEEFANSVVRFLEFNEYKILKNKGGILKVEADKKALYYNYVDKHRSII